MLAVAVGCKPSGVSNTPDESAASSRPTSTGRPPAPESSTPNGRSAAATAHPSPTDWDEALQSGRYTLAAAIAMGQCQSGTATSAQSQSLICPAAFFPPAQLVDESSVPAGLPKAIWHYSQKQFGAALRQLDQDHSTDDAGRSEDADAVALRGRLLAESQRMDAFTDWLTTCNETTRRNSHFWAALGIWLGSHGEPRAAIGATLQAIRLDPTDQISYQRVATWLQAVERPEKAESFWQRARLIRGLIDMRDEWFADADGWPNPRRAAKAQAIAAALLEAGRPFESLQWTLHRLDFSGASPGTNRARQNVRQQIAQLLRRADLREISDDHHLISLDTGDFPFQDVVSRILRDHRQTRPNTPLIAKGSPSNVEAAAAFHPEIHNVAPEKGLVFRFSPRKGFADEIARAIPDASAMPGESVESLRMHEALGSGIGVIDYDRDGWPDLLFGQGDSLPPDLIGDQADCFFRNVGGRFVDVTASTGIQNWRYAFGVCVGDVNQDGFDDVAIANLGVNVVYLNNGDGTFADITDRLGSQRGPHADSLDVTDDYANGLFSTSIALGDLDGDQLPDLYECNYVELKGLFERLPMDGQGRIPQKTPRSLFAEPDRVWMQDQAGVWRREDISTEVAEPGTALGVILGDIIPEAGDAVPRRNEVFVGNDGRPNHLLRRSEDGAWTQWATLRGIANTAEGLPSASMGIEAADFDHNGRMDFLITNFSTEPTSFYLQSKTGQFVDRCVRFGLDGPTRPMVGFGCKAIDFNRDGWLDVCIVNGHVDRLDGQPYEMPPQCFLRSTETGDQGFVTVEPVDSSGFWTTPSLGRTMARLDFDRDGRFDLVVNHIDRDVALLNNRCVGGGSVLQFEFVGRDSERSAVGAKVEVIAGDRKWVGFVVAGDGYLCSDESCLEFCLGQETVIQSVTVHWPTGPPQEIPVDGEGGIRPGGRFLIVEQEPPWICE